MLDCHRHHSGNDCRGLLHCLLGSLLCWAIDGCSLGLGLRMMSVALVVQWACWPRRAERTDSFKKSKNTDPNQLVYCWW